MGRCLKATGHPAAEERIRSQPPPCLVESNDSRRPVAGVRQGAERSGGAPPTLRALVVDDNECNRLVLGHMVAFAGGTVEQAADGVEALEKLADRTFDIVFMDIAMPRLDGAAATLALRKAGNTVPVVAVTAHYDACDADRLAAFGFDGLIPKPIDMAGVLDWLLRLTRIEPPTG